MTVILCLVKGGLAGFISALLFRIIQTKNKYVAVFAAAVAAPVVNTGIFVLGGFIIIDTITEVFGLFGTDLTGISPAYIIFVLCVGVNFFIELAVNIICAPAIYTVDRVVEKQILKRSAKKADIKNQNKEVTADDNLS